MRLVLCVLTALAIAGPALAALAPEYYQRARDTAPDVVTLTLSRVYNAGGMVCEVTARVKTVERGSTYHPGDEVKFKVPCIGPNDNPPAGGAVYQGKRELTFSSEGRAWFATPGVLALDQYEILS